MTVVAQPRVKALMARGAWILRSFLMALLTVVLVLATTFALIRLAPGSPESMFLGLEASPEAIAQFRAENGLDDPPVQQFLIYLGNMLRGDFGTSLVYKTDVLPLIISRLAASLLLVLCGFAASLLIGVTLGTLAGWRPRSFIARFADGYTAFFYSQPEFLTGAMVILAATAWLPWLPTSGMSQPGQVDNPVGDVALHLIAPVLVLAASRSAVYARITSVSIRRTRNQDYVRTHRAYGLPDRVILWKYVLRNGMLPVSSTIGIEFRHLLAGAVIVEVIFSWPGFGRLLFDAILGRDLALIMGCFVVVSVITIFVNFLTDLSYRVLDPRIRG